MITGKAGCGIRYAVKRGGSAVAYCALGISCGTRSEAGFHSGIAHFTEHTLFKGTANVEDRSLMNLCFVMNDEYKELEQEFLDFAMKERGMVGIKGHRSVGGFRASCYNAQTIEGCEALVACMKEFEAKH